MLVLLITPMGNCPYSSSTQPHCTKEMQEGRLWSNHTNAGDGNAEIVLGVLEYSLSHNLRRSKN